MRMREARSFLWLSIWPSVLVQKQASEPLCAGGAAQAEHGHRGKGICWNPKSHSREQETRTCLRTIPVHMEKQRLCHAWLKSIMSQKVATECGESRIKSAPGYFCMEWWWDYFHCGFTFLWAGKGDKKPFIMHFTCCKQSSSSDLQA